MKVQQNSTTKQISLFLPKPICEILDIKKGDEVVFEWSSFMNAFKVVKVEK